MVSALVLSLESGVEIQCRLGGRIDAPQAGQRLLAYLAVRGPSDRDRTLDDLWPGSPRYRQLANLRSVRWRLPPSVAACVLSDQVSGRHNLRLDDCEVPMIDMRSSGVPGSGPEQIAIVSRPLLPGWFDEWVITAQREHLRWQLESLVEMAGRWEQSHPALAVDAALAALELDPHHWPARRLVERLSFRSVVGRSAEVRAPNRARAPGVPTRRFATLGQKGA